MAGVYVGREVIDQKVGQAILHLRFAFEEISHINDFLSNNPSVNNVDPLTGTFNYTADEAYALRLVFQTLNQVHTDQAAIFATASKFTGLE